MTEEISADKPDKQDAGGLTLAQFLTDIWLFLNRDIRTFLPKSKKDIPAIEHKTDEPIASLVDPDRLSSFIFQRKILDWRDHAHANITRTGRELQHQLDDLVNQKLSKIGLFDQFFPDLARDVLQNELRHAVGEIYKESKNIEYDINEINTTRDSSIIQRLYIDPAHHKLAFDLQINFVPSEQETILNTIDKSLNGSEGIVTNIRDQITKIATQLILTENEA
ncbi:hypothetical protein ACFOHU_06360 [Ottowia pentelensis]|uniref:Uncharacterized protein n=1 Tax=Ottowia pentelensis TaxID=511108 RepID=A0ABV6PSY2_9BURK